MSAPLDLRPPGSGRLAERSVSTPVSTVFSLASTAPAYSLAVTVGLLASLVGDWSPLLLVASALPIVLVILCFGELNAAEPDCGTCYAWASRAFGRRVGWVNGWMAIAACVLVMTNLVQTAAIYAYTVVGAESLAASRPAQAVLGVALLTVMTYLAHRGITVAARVQVVLFGAEALALAYLALAALATPALPASGAGPTLSASGIAGAMLVAVFLYWGWDSSFSVNEESDAPTATPVRAALLAMAGLVVIYAGFTWAVSRYAGAGRLSEVGEDDLFAVLAESLMGTTGGTLLAGAVLVSALASAQTTILPSARSAFSMARRGDLPAPLAAVSRTGSPSAATWAFAGLSALVYVFLIGTSDAVLADSVAATAVLVAAYYATTCLAVPFFFGRDSARRPVRRILVPALAGLVFGVVLVVSLLGSTPTTLVAVALVAGLGVAYVLVKPSPRRNSP